MTGDQSKLVDEILLALDWYSKKDTDWFRPERILREEAWSRVEAVFRRGKDRGKEDDQLLLTDKRRV